MNGIIWVIMDNIEIGHRIRQARLAAGLTQKQLAKAAGVSRGAVSLWESGTTVKIGASVLTDAARAMGVTTDWLLKGEPRQDVVGVQGASAAQNTKVQTELSDIWQKLTASQRQTIVDQAAAMAAANAQILKELG